MCYNRGEQLQITVRPVRQHRPNLSTFMLTKEHEMDSSIVNYVDASGETKTFTVLTEKGYRFNLPDGMSYCTACKKLKPIGEFNKDKKNVHGLKVKCRECSHDHYAKTQKENNKTSMRKRNLNVKFSLSSDEYEALSHSQGNVCAICGQPETKINQGSIAQLGVDHDHETGRIRGLLCQNCNLGLGHFKDSIQSLSNAIDYLMER